MTVFANTADTFGFSKCAIWQLKSWIDFGIWTTNSIWWSWRMPYCFKNCGFLTFSIDPMQCSIQNQFVKKNFFVFIVRDLELISLFLIFKNKFFLLKRHVDRRSGSDFSFGCIRYSTISWLLVFLTSAIIWSNCKMALIKYVGNGQIWFPF